MNYVLDAKIGSGSFGTVYEAHDASGNRYAVKLPVTEDEHQPDDGIPAELLRRQYEFLSSLSHRRIVKALDFDSDSPHGPILVTELIDGVDLKTYVETRGIEDLVLIVAKVLDALRYLHSLGAVHGDLKPDSILVSQRDGNVEVTLVDAGFDYGKGSQLPTLVGTLPYLAPEIIRNMPGDGRSDLYSLGVILHEVLTGRCPFGGTSVEEILKKHLEHVPDLPSKLNGQVGSSWDEFTSTLLKKEPFLRYKDAVHAGLELERLFGASRLFLDNILMPDCAPMVGRADEMKRLTQLLFPPRGRGVIVFGERGCGVSRVLHEVESRARAKGQRVYTVCLDEKMPAFAQIVEAILGDEISAREISREPGSRSGQSESDYFEGVLNAFQSSLSPHRKHLLAVDRGEVMDSSEMRMLGAVAVRLSGLMGVVVGHQSDQLGQEGRPEYATFETVRLGLLGPDSLETILKNHFGVSAMPPELVEELHSVSHGNPGLIDMILRHLWSTASTRIVANQGILELVWDKTIPIPGTVRDMMQKKVDGLSTEALDVLKFICVSAGQVERRLVAAVASAGAAESALEELTGTGLIEESEDKTAVGLRWTSLSDVVRQSVAPQSLRDAGLRLAAVMEARPKKGQDLYRLGVLYLEGGECVPAFKYLVTSGDYFARFSPRDAISAYSKARECDVAPDQAAEIEDKIGSLKLARGDLAGAAIHFEHAAGLRPSSERKLGWVRALQDKTSESIEILTRCKAAASEKGDRIETAMILSDLGYVYSRQARKALALKLLKQAHSVFKGEGMAGEAGMTANRVGIVEMRSGNFKGASRAWNEAMADFEKAGDRKTAAVCLMNLGLCRRKQMDFERAEAAFKQALSIFDELKVLHERASCCQNYAIMLFDLGNLAHAQRLADEALGVKTLLGRGPETITSRILLSAIAVESGNWVEADKRLTRLLEETDPMDSYHRAMIKRYLAAATAMRGDSRRAFALVDESHDLAGQADDTEGRGQAMLRKSEILLRFGRPKEALRIARKALTALSLASSPLLANEAQRVAGEALCLCADPAAGISELMQAMEGLESVPESLHMARVLRALALAFYLDRDHDSFDKYLKQSIDLFRNANARYEYANAILLGGREALGRGNLLQARHYLMEAARLFETLDIPDLNKKAVGEMDRIPSGDLETKAVTSLSEISRTLSSSHDLTTVLNLVMDLAIEYLGAERGALMLEDEGTGELATFVERKMDSASLREVMAISKSIVESVRSTRKSVIASDATKDPRFKDSKSVKIHNIMSVMCVPITMGSKLLGIIYLDSRGVPSGFSTLERAFVDAFANQVSLAIVNAKLVGRLYDDVADLRVRAGEKYSFANIIGPGKRMQEVFRQVETAAKSTITVMVTGGSGTGKELIAGLLHERSPRRDKPLVKVNCAAIQRDLLETELFGIEKRVATGISPRSGIFERANGGTVFLDEVGDMPLTTQMKVLRVLAEQEFERVGGSKVLKVDVRVVSATNQDLRSLIKKDLFRKDLYFRLNAMRIHLPLLKERMEDLPSLVNYFLGKYTAQNSKPPMQVSEQAVGLLRTYSWPGNVRELEKCIEHAVVVAEGTQIRPEHLPPEILENLRSADLEGFIGQARGATLPDAVRDLETRLITAALREARGVKTVAADLLGIHESTLRKKMKMLGIRADRNSGEVNAVATRANVRIVESYD